MSVAQFISELILPPSGLFVLMLGAWILGRRFPRSGLTLFLMALVCLFLLSLPIVSTALIAPLQKAKAVDLNQLPADMPTVIVVLAGGRERSYYEYGGDTVSALTMERVRYAGWLGRRTNIPIMVSGGRPDKEYQRAEAYLMKDVLAKEFLLRVEFEEGDSRNTFENALYCAKMLKQLNMTRIFLVTHAWHMPRAKRAFEAQGIEVVPAPTAFYRIKKLSLHDFMPSAKAMRFSYFAFHEYLGLLWYSLRYY